MARPFTWSPSMLERLLRLRDEQGKGWHEIAETLGRPHKACSARYWHEEYKRRRDRAAARAGNGEQIGEVHAPPRYMPAVVDARLIEDRDRRAEAAESRNFTSTFFGDPPPGYSALDRKRAQV